jgi:hypothetical protein
MAVSTLIEPLADILTSTLESITLTAGTSTIAVKGYRWAPQQLSKVPAGVVEIPTIRRSEVDEGETELGSDDWWIAYPVILYVEWTGTPDRDMQRAVELLEEWIAAIDGNPTDGTPFDQVAGVDDAKVVSADPDIDITEQERPLLRYVTEVQVHLRVPYPES